jgi:putative flippase GtrA
MTGTIGQLVRFALVGMTNTAVTLASYAVLTAAGTPAAAAAAAAFGLGAANGYRLNRRWTFRAPSTGAVTAGRYVAVQALGAGLSAAGVAMATGRLGLPRMAAEAVVLPWVTCTTFVLVRRLVFVGEPAA